MDDNDERAEPAAEAGPSPARDPGDPGGAHLRLAPAPSRPGRSATCWAASPARTGRRRWRSCGPTTRATSAASTWWRSRAAGRSTTRPEYNDWVRELLDPKTPTRLSIQALETLAVIAYKQPVTLPEIIELRGVKSGGVLKTLLEKRLIRILGRKEVVGRPILYGTTRQFLLHFGLKDLEELPQIEQFAEVLGEEVDVAGLSARSRRRDRPRCRWPRKAIPRPRTRRVRIRRARSRPRRAAVSSRPVEERLQKILSRAGIASRRGAEKVMAEGRVTVNGETVREMGSKADIARDDVRVDGVRLRAPERPVYLVLNKPKGAVTTRHDPEGRTTVMDLVPRGGRPLPGGPSRRDHRGAPPAHQRRRLRGARLPPSLRGAPRLPGQGPRRARREDAGPPPGRGASWRASA